MLCAGLRLSRYERDGGRSTEWYGEGLLESGWEAPTFPRVQVRTSTSRRSATTVGIRTRPCACWRCRDYGCGYCRQFHVETFPTLLSEFIETGMVEWKFMPFITGMFDNSLAATEAAECALLQSHSVFDRLNARLWMDQTDWKRSGEPEVVVRAMAADAGADLAELDACLADDRQLDRIAGATRLAQTAGVRGTPTFFVFGYQPLQGALPTDAFREILTAVHAEATQGGGN